MKGKEDRRDMDRTTPPGVSPWILVFLVCSSAWAFPSFFSLDKRANDKRCLDSWMKHLGPHRFAGGPPIYPAVLINAVSPLDILLVHINQVPRNVLRE